ncbi:YjgB family protein [Clostridium saccharoperbutylacetonicum]
MKKFNKKLSLLIIMALCSVIISGCSNSNRSVNDTKDTTQTNNETSNTTDQSKTEENKILENKNEDSSKTENNQDSILKNIKTLAEEGKIINSDFADKSFNISDVEKNLGKADNAEWVTDAKGYYSTYSKYKVVFGSNKGGRIFEVRSFDSSLNNISLSNVEKYFGSPNHNVTVNNEKILGYVAGSDYKILFVFKVGADSKEDPKLDHYSVLYPQGTVNSMAGDSGREW